MRPSLRLLLEGGRYGNDGCIMCSSKIQHNVTARMNDYNIKIWSMHV